MVISSNGSYRWTFEHPVYYGWYYPDGHYQYVGVVDIQYEVQLHKDTRVAEMYQESECWGHEYGLENPPIKQRLYFRLWDRTSQSDVPGQDMHQDASGFNEACENIWNQISPYLDNQSAYHYYFEPSLWAQGYGTGSSDRWRLPSKTSPVFACAQDCQFIPFQ